MASLNSGTSEGSGDVCHTQVRRLEEGLTGNLRAAGGRSLNSAGSVEVDIGPENNAGESRMPRGKEQSGSVCRAGVFPLSQSDQSG